MVLETGEKNLIPLSEEIEMVRHYLILEANRFDENFTYKIRIGENIDTNNITTPPMLLQPFIENAIWHGLLSSNKAVRELTIEIMQVDSSITVLIKDNGMGWANKSLSNPENFHKATGTKITKERIDLYNKNYKGKISSLTKNKINGKGEITGTETMLIIINGKETNNNERSISSIAKIVNKQHEICVSLTLDMYATPLIKLLIQKYSLYVSRF